MPPGWERTEVRRCFLEEEHVDSPKRRRVDEGRPYGRAAVDVVRDNDKLVHKRRLALVSRSCDKRRSSSSGDDSDNSSRTATRLARLVATLLTRILFCSSISASCSHQPEPAASKLGRKLRGVGIGDQGPSETPYVSTGPALVESPHRIIDAVAPEAAVFGVASVASLALTLNSKSPVENGTDGRRGVDRLAAVRIKDSDGGRGICEATGTWGSCLGTRIIYLSNWG